MLIEMTAMLAILWISLLSLGLRRVLDGIGRHARHET